MEQHRPDVVVRCAGMTYLGTLESTRAEWAVGNDRVLVSVVVRGFDGTRRRFYFEVDDAVAWAAFEEEPDRRLPIEANAMKVEAQKEKTANG